jgi:hypothetical protein
MRSSIRFARFAFLLISIFALNTIATAQPEGCGGGWDTSFTTNGTDGQVNVVVADGLGNYYVGGRFTSIQGVRANGIAKWNGTNWEALGTGTGWVNAIAISGTDVYVGGSFAGAGGIQSRNIAKWDGTSWSAIGNGLGGGTHVVQAVEVYNGDVYVGGNFNLNDGSAGNGLVRWDGTSFSSVGTFNGQVMSLKASGGSLYVGGDVTYDSGPNHGIVRLTGTTWSALGTGANTSIKAINFSGSDMYVVGSRIVIPGQETSHVAKFDGTNWTRLGFFSDGIINAVTIIGSDVYVGGYIPFPNNMFNSIAKWNGSTWSGVGTGLSGGTSQSERVMALANFNNTLIVGGNYTTAGGLAARNLAKVTNGIWSAFPGTGVDANVGAVAVSGSDVYIGGSFISAGPITANRIAKWNSITNTFSGFGTGITGAALSSVNAMAFVGSDLYVGGSFSNAGGVVVNNIAKWNGTNWSALGTGVNGIVTAMKVVGTEIYVGGQFTTAGGQASNRLAKWTGSAWVAIPNPIPNVVTDIEVIGNNIYVSSDTTTIENPNYLLKYDGTNWTPMAPAMGGHGITSLAVMGTDLYISGAFPTANGLQVNRVAKWDGSTWSGLGNGLPGFGISNIVKIAASGPYIFASGDFTDATSGLNRAARWDGFAWSNLGSGLDAPARMIEAAGGDVFFGGGFSTAGCNFSPYFARWRQSNWIGSTNADWHTAANWGNGIVPPAGSGITISNADVSISSQDVTVSSLIVGNGRTVTIGAGRTLTVTGDLDLSSGAITGSGNLIVNGALRLGGNISGLNNVVVNGDLALIGGIISGQVNITNCRGSAISGGSTTSHINGMLRRCVASGSTYNFPVASGSVYAPVSTSNAVGTGTLTVDTRTGPHPDAAGLPARRLQRWWNITASTDAEVVGFDQAYRIYRIDGSVTALTSNVNSAANTAIAAGVTSFGAFTLGEAPESIVSISGRVRRPDGRGVRYINVTLSDGNGGVWTTVTKYTGHFSFDGLTAPRQYTITVEPRKSAVFAAPQQQVIVSGSVSNINFTTSTP